MEDWTRIGLRLEFKLLLYAMLLQITTLSDTEITTLADTEITTLSDAEIHSMLLYSMT